MRDQDATDAPEFLDLAHQLVKGVAVANGLTSIVLVHVDHWFGPRWLGFCGKLFGEAGVRTQYLNGHLTPPPFHPHRILSAQEYWLSESKSLVYLNDVESLHGYRRSHDNIDRSLRRDTLYMWYSGNTVFTGKGVIMAYIVHGAKSQGWYAAFDRTPSWHLSQTINIAPDKIANYLLHSVSQNTSVGNDG